MSEHERDDHVARQNPDDDRPQVSGESGGGASGTNIGRGGDALVQDDVALGRPDSGQPVDGRDESKKDRIPP